MIKLEDLSNDKSIKKNNKISIFDCYRIGNRIFGNIGISGNTSFINNEVLIEFPFIAKSTFRRETKIEYLAAYIMYNSNKFQVQVGIDTVSTVNYEIWNFEFYI